MTPLKKVYLDAKSKHPGMLLLFRMGDFYEAFAEDAEVLARECNLTLTTRDGKEAMAGFPHHSLEFRLRELLAAGHRVAVCEQESPGVVGPGKRQTRTLEPEPKTQEGNMPNVTALLIPTNVAAMAELTDDPKSTTKFSLHGVCIEPLDGGKRYIIAASSTKRGAYVIGASIDPDECDFAAPTDPVPEGPLPSLIVDPKDWKKAFGNPNKDGLRWVVLTPAGLKVYSPEGMVICPWFEGGKFPDIKGVVPRDQPTAWGGFNSGCLAEVAGVASYFTDDEDGGVRFESHGEHAAVVKAHHDGNHQSFTGVVMPMRFTLPPDYTDGSKAAETEPEPADEALAKRIYKPKKKGKKKAGDESTVSA